jgi:hypothetical protein
MGYYLLLLLYLQSPSVEPPTTNSTELTGSGTTGGAEAVPTSGVLVLTGIFAMMIFELLMVNPNLLSARVSNSTSAVPSHTGLTTSKARCARVKGVVKVASPVKEPPLKFHISPGVGS